MPTSISNIWTPDIWAPDINEKVAAFPALISSPAIVRTPEFDGFASGGGITVNMPYFHDITDQADGIQVENTQPTRQTITAGKQICPILNRETANDATAMASGVSGADVVGAITDQLAIRRQKQRQATIVKMLDGLFNVAGAPNAAAALSAVRYGGTTAEIFLEAGASPAAAQLIDQNKFIDAASLLGERAQVVLSGSIMMHPNIRASLIKQDQISFEHYSDQRGVVLEVYKGMRVFVSNLLRRAGGTSGFVYTTYILAPGIIAWGEKPQLSDVVDVASLALWHDKQKNVEEIYDRTRFLVYLNGTKWVGTPAGQSATNAELATSTNWNLDYASADRCGVVALRSNG